MADKERAHVRGQLYETGALHRLACTVPDLIGFSCLMTLLQAILSGREVDKVLQVTSIGEKIKLLDGEPWRCGVIVACSHSLKLHTKVRGQSERRASDCEAKDLRERYANVLPV